MSDSPVICLGYLRGLVDLLRQRYLPVDSVLKAMGVAKDQLGDIDRLLPVEVVARAFAAAETLTGDANIGMRLGLNMRPSDLGLVGTLAVTGASSGALFDLHARFEGLVGSGSGAEYRVDAEAACMALVGPARAFMSRQTVEFSVVSWLTLVRWLIQPEFNPLRIEFACPPPPQTAELEKFLRCPLHYNCAETRVHFPARFLAFALSYKSRVRNSMEEEARHRLSALRGIQRDPNPVLAELKQFLAEQLGYGIPDINRAADAVGMSVARLQTVLEATGHQYEELVEALRKCLAETYLGQRSLTLVDVGLLLGFSAQDDFLATLPQWFDADYRDLRARFKA